MISDLLVKPDQYYTLIRPEMFKYIPSDAARVLEIGCGEGNFGVELKKRNMEVWGVEFSPDQAVMAEKKLHKVFAGDIVVIIDLLPDQYFDVIICNDVLEHLIDPYSVLKRLKIKLSEKGVVVSSIPNIRYFRNMFDYIFRKNWDYTDSGIMDKTHYRFFTINSIRKLYENLGFEIIRMEGINPSKSIRPLIWNILFLGTFWDIKFLQFATVARLKK